MTCCVIRNGTRSVWFPFEASFSDLLRICTLKKLSRFQSCWKGGIILQDKSKPGHNRGSGHVLPGSPEIKIRSPLLTNKHAEIDSHRDQRACNDQSHDIFHYQLFHFILLFIVLFRLKMMRVPSSSAFSLRAHMHSAFARLLVQK